MHWAIVRELRGTHDMMNYDVILLGREEGGGVATKLVAYVSCRAVPASSKSLFTLVRAILRTTPGPRHVPGGELNECYRKLDKIDGNSQFLRP